MGRLEQTLVRYCFEEYKKRGVNVVVKIPNHIERVLLSEINNNSYPTQSLVSNEIPLSKLSTRESNQYNTNTQYNAQIQQDDNCCCLIL